MPDGPAPDGRAPDAHVKDAEPVDAEPVDDGKVGVTVDGRSLRVPKNTLLLDAAAEVGIHIPVYCAHPKMDPVAVCRMCLVRVEKMPKLQPACATYVADGMVATTQGPEVAKVREGVLEFLLLNHPLDCPVCDRGGECDLQDFAFRYGPQTSRFPTTEKVHFNKALPLSEKIELDQERCILCWRCTRYYDEITGERELVLQERGVNTLIATFDDKPLTSAFQGNLPEICPVGALTHRQYRFKARPWDLQRTKSVCPECSYGCNINADTRDFEVKRFTSRDNPLVDDMWLCDRGRYSATRWNDVSRVRQPVIRERGVRRDVTVEEAVRVAAESIAGVTSTHGPTAVGVLTSANCINEEFWLVQRLAREVIATPHLDHQLEAFDGLSPTEHALGIAEIEECDAVVVLGPEPELNAPVLTLRLHKAATKRGVAVHRLTSVTAAADIRVQIGDAARVGVIADEADRSWASEVASVLGSAGGTTVARLTVTRGVNGRGAKDLGVLPGLLPGYRRAPITGKNGREILEAAAAGTVAALILVNIGNTLDDAADLATRALARAEVVVAIEAHPGPVSAAATVLIPGHAYFEKLGTVTNVEGRVQRVRQALPAATATPTDTRVITMLANALGADWEIGDPLRVSRALSVALPAYAAAGNGGRVNWGRASG